MPKKLLQLCIEKTSGKTSNAHTPPRAVSCLGAGVADDPTRTAGQSNSVPSLSNRLQCFRLKGIPQSYNNQFLSSSGKRSPEFLYFYYSFERNKRLEKLLHWNHSWETIVIVYGAYVDNNHHETMRHTDKSIEGPAMKLPVSPDDTAHTSGP
ncbi:hypothetical protein AVEN_15417-1 [Araneus ventricosus]|uniref:Uncharacterized protein n=1 Tax=Araneus ventricosus TaxID=182803 RepID=A0A4Y2CRY4_ARAVE|nr:hypothetical protein AVEN_15417-1 [Araneus ventricosus]